jgi:hypothetical protein
MPIVDGPDEIPGGDRDLALGHSEPKHLDGEIVNST